MNASHIVHEIAPVYDKRSRVLVLGTMPSPASREAGFFYGHPQNRFWRVMARLADEPVPTTSERKRDFCLRHHIALWDVVAECDIDGASDASIRNAHANDLALITHSAPIEAVFCTGAKAFDLYNALGCEQACGMPAVKLPSTSAANAAFKLDDLTAAYAQIFEKAQPFEPPTLDVNQVVALEQAIAASGTSLAELMDRAGAALARRVRQVWDEIAAGTYPKELLPLELASDEPCIAVLCGNGNNGGDGWVAAELLTREGLPVVLVSTKAPEDLRAQPARDAALRAFPHVSTIINPTYEELAKLMNRTRIAVDALFGCGLRGGITTDPYVWWVRLANNSCGHHVTVAADVASGVSAQSGYGVLQSTARILADETVTMMVRKPGLSARECGKVKVVPLAYLEPFLEDGLPDS